ncbi:MAG: division/cell wall cluster transcriptional repressor MraZ [Nitrospiraceae bacterium]|nr:division/cell wall cluster transcriptional repressor MraZ [Nitrospiraceae bacterium]
MPGFSGKYYYTMDEKGRLMVPAPFREIIFANYSPKLMVANSAFDACLNVYPLEEWIKLEEKVKGLPRSDRAVRYFLRKVIASAVETAVDRQGRILVPSAQRQDSGLDSEVVLVGQVEMIELWSKSGWLQETDASRVDRVAFEESLSRYGI